MPNSLSVNLNFALYTKAIKSNSTFGEQNQVLLCTICIHYWLVQLNIFVPKQEAQNEHLLHLLTQCTHRKCNIVEYLMYKCIPLLQLESIGLKFLNAYSKSEDGFGKKQNDHLARFRRIRVIALQKPSPIITWKAKHTWLVP